MKAIKVKIATAIKNDPYGYSNVKFAWCTKPDKNKRVDQLASLAGCREDLVDTLRRYANSNSKKFDFLRARLLAIPRIASSYSLTKAIQLRKKADLQMQASLKLVNHYERKHGWALTRLYEGNPGKLIPSVKANTPPDMAPYIFPYVVVGSNKWIKSPHYASLYALLLRLGRSGFAGKFKSQAQLNKELANFARKQTSDGGHLRTAYKRIDILLENQAELLEGRKDLFKQKVLSNNDGGYHEGVGRLCRNNTMDLRLRGKFAEICKRY